LIELEDSLLPKLNTHQLPDHPDDVDCQIEAEADQSACTPSIDQRLDAMADAILDDDDCKDDNCDEEDGASGLAGFVNYIYKDHLPKCESRYEKLADSQQSDRQLTATNGTTSSRVKKALTPEQMVIACHADAELKRAFHGKHLTCKFGVQRKASPKRNKADATDHAEKQSSKAPIHDDQQSTLTNIQQGSFDTKPSHMSETAVHWCIGPSATDHGNAHQSQATMITNKEAPYYKEDDRSLLRNPLSVWASRLWRFTLCLGLRVLRPP
jgi:hypothetical protein